MPRARRTEEKVRISTQAAIKIFLTAAFAVSLIALLASIWAKFFVEAACLNGTTITSLPCTLSTAGTTYQITGPITGTGDLTVGANNITVNGSDMAISGPVDVSIQNRTGVTIRDVNVTGDMEINGGGHNQILSSAMSHATIKYSSHNLFADNFIHSNRPTQDVIFSLGDMDLRFVYTTDFNTIRNNKMYGYAVNANGSVNDAVEAGNRNTRFVKLIRANHSLFVDNDIRIYKSYHLSDDSSGLMVSYYSHYNQFEHNTLEHNSTTVRPTADPTPNLGSPPYLAIGVTSRDQSNHDSYVSNIIRAPDRTLTITSGNERGASHEDLFKNNQFLGDGGETGVGHIQAVDGTMTFERNLFVASDGYGITVPGCGAGSTCVFTNNTVVSSNAALWGDGANNPANPRTLSLQNNIFYSKTAPAIAMSSYRLSPAPGYNDYYRETGTPPIVYAGGNMNTMPGDTGSVNLNPGFNANYEISSTSPVKDLGNPSTPVPPGGGSRVDMGYAEVSQATNLDTTSPTAALTSTSQGDVTPTERGWYVSSTGILSGTANDNVALTSVALIIDGGAPQPAFGTYSWGYDLSELNPRWTNGSTHTVAVRATDTAGNVTTAAPVTLTVNSQPPTGTITAPTAGATVSGDNVMVQVGNATDDLGAGYIAGVQFSIDGTEVGPEATVAQNGVYQFQWETVYRRAATGNHTLQARIRDYAGNLTMTPTVTVRVDNTGGCIPAWQCTTWSACSSGNQTRTCSDTNNCGVNTGRPPETQSCGGTCTESWTCGGWGSCTNSQQSRSCTCACAEDPSASCQTANQRPPLTQACMVSPSLSCGPACADNTRNNILATACAAPRLGVNHTIQDITLSDSPIAANTPLIVTIAYGCYAGNPPHDAVGLWYYNGTTWRFLKSWPAPLQGCNTTGENTDGTVQYSFTPDNIPGATQYVRASLAENTDLSLNACPSYQFGNVDDMSFTVSSDATQPLVSISTPSNNATVSGSVPITATASDNAQVTRVEFYRDEAKLGQVTSSPYTFTWDTTRELPGAHTLHAVAFDAAGNSGTASALVTVVDRQAPTISLGTPFPNSTVSGIVYIQSGAYDNVGVTSITYRLDGVNLAPTVVTPTLVRWDSTATVNGSHVLTATARDAAGNSTTSAPVTIIVNNILTSTPISCGPACAGTVSNLIRGPSCTTPNRDYQHSNNNAIEDISLSAGTVVVGESVTATITYNCSSDNPTRDGIALWYYNGSWRRIQYWPPPLTGCDFNYTNDTDGTLSTTFAPLAGSTTTQYVRAIISSAPPTADSSVCPDIRHGNIDDLRFSVVTTPISGGGNTNSGGGGGKSKLPQ